jgi:hypothetical protein
VGKVNQYFGLLHLSEAEAFIEGGVAGHRFLCSLCNAGYGSSVLDLSFMWLQVLILVEDSGPVGCLAM